MSGEDYITFLENITEQNELLYSAILEQNELIAQNNATNLYVVGCMSAILVCVLLYKFFKLFY